MARRLTAGVTLRHPSSGAVVFMPEGSDLPDWAEGLVGEHVLTANDGTPESEPAEPSSEPRTDVKAADPPPLAGAGSSRGRWAEYAKARDVEVTGSMGRDDIVTACRAAGVPTE